MHCSSRCMWGTQRTFFFHASPFSQLCLICSCGLSWCQLCYRPVPPGRLCFNSLPWCWVLAFRGSRKSRQDSNGWRKTLCHARPSPNLHCFIWGSVYPERVVLYHSQGRPTVSHPAAFKRPPPALNQTTCEINITLTHVSNSWCQNQTERVKRKKEEKLQKAFEVVWESVNARVCFSFYFDFSIMLQPAGAKMIIT